VSDRSQNAPYLVKRLAPPMGYGPGTRQRVSVAYHSFTLEHAIEWAREQGRNGARFWIERRGQIANRRFPRPGRLVWILVFWPWP